MPLMSLLPSKDTGNQTLSLHHWRPLTGELETSRKVECGVRQTFAFFEENSHEMPGGGHFVIPVWPPPSTLLLLQDVSCNEITALPQQIGQLKSLRELNVRRNYLKVLPPGKKVGQEEEHARDVTFFIFLYKRWWVLCTCAHGLLLLRIWISRGSERTPRVRRKIILFLW